MDFEYLHKIFPNYTIGMYKGNEPKKKRLSVNGDYFNWYEDMSVKHGRFCEEYRRQCVSGEITFWYSKCQKGIYKLDEVEI